MEVPAVLRHAKISAQKCRLVANQVRGLPVEKALYVLKFSPKKASKMVKKLLESAIANAENNDGLDVDELRVSTIFVDEATTHKRFRARAKGRSAQILKRTCHVTLKVSDTQESK